MDYIVHVDYIVPVVSRKTPKFDNYFIDPHPVVSRMVPTSISMLLVRTQPEFDNYFTDPHPVVSRMVPNLIIILLNRTQ